MSTKQRHGLTAFIVAATLLSATAWANTCEEEYAYCYYLASLETDERARDAKQNDCDHEYGACNPQPAVSTATSTEQTLAPSCPAGYTEVYLWTCKRLAAYTPPCNYAGPGNYNVLHLYCQSGSAFYDAGPTGDFACGACF